MLRRINHTPIHAERQGFSDDICPFSYGKCCRFASILIPSFFLTAYFLSLQNKKGRRPTDSAPSLCNFSATAIVAAAAIIAATAAVAIPAVVPTAAKQNDDQNNDPQAIAAVIKAPHKKYPLDRKYFESQQSRFSTYLMSGRKMCA